MRSKMLPNEMKRNNKYLIHLFQIRSRLDLLTFYISTVSQCRQHYSQHEEQIHAIFVAYCSSCYPNTTKKSKRKTVRIDSNSADMPELDEIGQTDIQAEPNVASLDSMKCMIVSSSEIETNDGTMVQNITMESIDVQPAIELKFSKLLQEAMNNGPPMFDIRSIVNPFRVVHRIGAAKHENQTISSKNVFLMCPRKKTWPSVERMCSANSDRLCYIKIVIIIANRNKYPSMR